MNMNENSMSHVHLTKDDLIGSHQWKGRMDLLNIVFIGLSNDLPEHDEQYDLHRLLGTLLSMEMSPDEKLDILENEYEIPIGDDIREEVIEYIHFLKYELNHQDTNSKQKRRTLGRLEGKMLFMADDFDETLDCFKE